MFCCKQKAELIFDTLFENSLPSSSSREQSIIAQQSAKEEVVLDQLRPSTAPLESTPHNVKNTKFISLMKREAMTEKYSRDAN